MIYIPHDCGIFKGLFTYLEAFLIKCHKAGHAYKTLESMARNIKAFLKVMAERGNNPCLDNLHFDIIKQWEVVPADHEKI